MLIRYLLALSPKWEEQAEGKEQGTVSCNVSAGQFEALQESVAARDPGHRLIYLSERFLHTSDTARS